MKLHSVPVKRYVYKYMQPFLDEKGVLEVTQRVAKIQRSVKVIQYFEKNKDSPWKLKIKIPVSSQWVVYALAMEWARQFREKLFSHTAVCVKNGMPALRAMRQFLEHHNITDDEYDLMNAYRTWERVNKFYLEPKQAIEEKRREKAEKPRRKAGGKQLSLFE
jgi:hypothetical protein